MTKKILIALGLVGAIFLYFQLKLGAEFSFENFRVQQDWLEEYRAQAPYASLLGIVGLYVIVAGLSLRGAGFMTIAAGVFFGLRLGIFAVSVACTAGATLHFVASRYLLRNRVQSRFANRIRAINQGIERKGAFHFLSLRMIPMLPYFMISLAFGGSQVKPITFAWVSLIGMLAGTAVLVNAGMQLGSLQASSDIISPRIIIALALLGALPLLVRRVVGFVRVRKLLARFDRPKSFDYNVVVIGAGSGGLVASYIAAAIKAKVALVEKNRMGGDCLNTGCVPSKALIRSAKMLHYARRANDWGFRRTDVDFDFGEVMERVQRVIQKIEPHDSIARYEKLGVECIQGTARVVDPYHVEVDGRRISARNIIVATGARPLVPPIDGIDKVKPLTSDSLWNLRTLPRRFVVVGGGPIGCEIAQSMSRFGAEVTQIEMTNQIMGREDPDVSAFVRKRFEQEGIRVLTGHRVQTFYLNGDVKVIVCDGPDGTVEVECDEVLIALGRTANVKGFGLEELEIELTERGTIRVDEFLRTKYPNIYACGDVAGPYQFTHYAAHQAWYATVNALFSGLKSFRLDDRVVPWSTFTDPEVARVGLNETEAKQLGIPHQVVRYGLDDLDRAIADGEDYGLVKVITPPGKDTVFCATIVGPHAGDILPEYVAAMKHGFGLNSILGTIHVYPTLGEANKYAGGVWKSANKPEWALRLLQHFHRWRRS